VVEAKREVPWTRPDDLDYAKDRPIPSMGGFHPDFFEALMVDGSVHAFKQSLAPAILRALFTRAAEDHVPGDAY
jgi:hypothetical protein